MECPICLNPLSSRGLFKKKILNSPCCNQNIHEKCLKRWLQENNTCPLCRENLELVPIASLKKCYQITKMQFARLIITLLSLFSFFIIILFASEYRIFATILFILIIISLLLFVVKTILKVSLRQCNDDNDFFNHFTIKQIIIHNPN